MVKVELTPDLVTTNQNDQIKTTEIPAINPNKYSPLMLIEGLTIKINSFLNKLNCSYLTVLLFTEKQLKIFPGTLGIPGNTLQYAGATNFGKQRCTAKFVLLK